MARSGNQAATLAASVDIPNDGTGPCRAYITGADVLDGRGRSLWLCYFALDGGRGGRQMVNTKPLRWREAARLCEALNRRSGLLADQQQPDEAVA